MEYITNASDQKKFLSEVEETPFYELPPEEKRKILDEEKRVCRGVDEITLRRQKFYRFGGFLLALCGEYF
ncbi:MAG: hypothetical protein LBG59_01420 [Candidatus Peribacteria bacterium]|jgi:hypothetical protein|nr:hypothetical protein [Candidatus Peribacteria bacterium]